VRSSQSTSLAGWLLQRRRMSGAGACPRWNITASSPNSGVDNDLGRYPRCAMTVSCTAALACGYCVAVSPSGLLPVTMQIFASHAHIRPISLSQNPSEEACAWNVSACCG
jgi:ferredoxin